MVVIDGDDVRQPQSYIRMRVFIAETRASGDEARLGAEPEAVNLQECGQSTSGEYARPQPCASRRGARP